MDDRTKDLLNDGLVAILDSGLSIITDVEQLDARLDKILTSLDEEDVSLETKEHIRITNDILNNIVTIIHAQTLVIETIFEATNLVREDIDENEQEV